MPRKEAGIAKVMRRMEAVLYRGAWPVRVTRALGIRPNVRTVRYHVLAGAATSMPTLSVAYASDFHAGPTTDPQVLLAGCAALRASAPDVLLLGGDFATVAASELDWLAPELGKIPAPCGRFAVLGNHDWLCETDYIVRRLESEGIEVLINRSARLRPPFDQVWICGLDDHWFGRPDARAAVAGADGIRVVLMHAPSGLLDLGTERFDVAFCGHTHGGQLALPGGVPIVVPRGALSRRYVRGRFRLGTSRTLIVSVGLGCVVLPLRFFAAPEIILCDLASEPQVSAGSASLHEDSR